VAADLVGLTYDNVDLRLVQDTQTYASGPAKKPHRRHQAIHPAGQQPGNCQRQPLQLGLAIRLAPA
jgi:hypothetical protein